MEPAPGARTAVGVAARHGLAATPVAELVGLGSVNRVFVVGQGDGRHVVRFAVDARRTDEFSTESWCLRVAADAGIASPAPVAHSVLDGVPYGVQRYVEHVRLDGLDRRDLWQRLGGYARRINAVPVPADAPPGLFSRFGRDLPAAWQAHLAYNLAELTEGDPLAGLGVYRAAERPWLRETMADLATADLAFGLSHGDLGTRNVLRRADGVLVLIDWGSASCGPVPYTDLATLTGHHDEEGDPSAADLLSFASGYGLDLDRVGPVLQAVRVVAALDLVRWARDRRPDRVRELVEAARATLTRAARGGGS